MPGIPRGVDPSDAEFVRPVPSESGVYSAKATDAHRSTRIEQVFSGDLFYLCLSVAYLQSPLTRSSDSPWLCCGGPINSSADLCDCVRDEIDLLFGLSPVVLLDCFTNTGQRFDAVACIETRRVDLMLEPGTAGKSLLANHRPFRLHQRSIKRLLCLRG